MDLNQSKDEIKEDFLMINNEIVIETSEDVEEEQKHNNNKRKYDETFEYNNNTQDNNSSVSLDSYDSVKTKSLKLYDEFKNAISNQENVYLQTRRCVDLHVNNKKLTKCRECNALSAKIRNDGVENCRFIGWRK